MLACEALVNWNIVGELEPQTIAKTLKAKISWFAHSGDSPALETKGYKKSLFAKIALNMNGLKEKAGMKLTNVKKQVASAPVPAIKMSLSVLPIQKPGKILEEYSRPSTTASSWVPALEDGLNNLPGMGSELSAKNHVTTRSLPGISDTLIIFSFIAHILWFFCKDNVRVLRPFHSLDGSM
jgi:hypothetical protein